MVSDAHRNSGLEVKKEFIIAYGQLTAGILDIFLWRDNFAGEDFNKPNSVRELSEDRPTVLLEFIQGHSHSWVWATISIECIEAMLTTHEVAVPRSRILREELARETDDRRNRMLPVNEEDMQYSDDGRCVPWLGARVAAGRPS